MTKKKDGRVKGRREGKGQYFKYFNTRLGIDNNIDLLILF